MLVENKISHQTYTWCLGDFSGIWMRSLVSEN